MSLSEWGLNNLKNNLQDLANDIDEYSSNSGYNLIVVQILEAHLLVGQLITSGKLTYI